MSLQYRGAFCAFRIDRDFPFAAYLASTRVSGLIVWDQPYNAHEVDLILRHAAIIAALTVIAAAHGV